MSQFGGWYSPRHRTLDCIAPKPAPAEHAYRLKRFVLQHFVKQFFLISIQKPGALGEVRPSTVSRSCSSVPLYRRGDTVHSKLSFISTCRCCYSVVSLRIAIMMILWPWTVKVLCCFCMSSLVYYCGAILRILSQQSVVVFICHYYYFIVVIFSAYQQQGLKNKR